MQKSNKVNKGKEIATEKERRERFKRFVSECVSSGRDNTAFMPIDEVEKIEGRSIVEVITDHLCRCRGIGVLNKDSQQKYYYEIDKYYDGVSLRLRNNHEKEEARHAVHHFVWSPVNFNMNFEFSSKDITRFVREFYRRGDYGFSDAARRALEFAIKNVGRSRL